MKLVSWNVNGLRACMNKGFPEFFAAAGADCFCLQETKMQEGQLELELPGYEQYYSSAEKKGYSGTAIFTREAPCNVVYGVGDPELDLEGRMITLEFPDYYLVTCYTPNAQEGLRRLPFRCAWDDAFRTRIHTLDRKKPVIACGDFNVAHEEIDLRHPSANRGNPGFSDEEREKFRKLLDAGFSDVFRRRNPDLRDAYTWWSYRFRARENNAGWRIDYFIVSNRLFDHVSLTPIYSEVLGSDHCPIGLEIEVPKCKN